MVGEGKRKEKHSQKVEGSLSTSVQEPLNHGFRGSWSVKPGLCIKSSMYYDNGSQFREELPASRSERKSRFFKANEKYFEKGGNNFRPSVKTEIKFSFKKTEICDTFVIRFSTQSIFMQCVFSM
jgi:hypothetical protein